MTVASQQSTTADGICVLSGGRNNCRSAADSDALAVVLCCEASEEKNHVV